MKIRTDFVTNSSSSSFITISVIDGNELTSERFFRDNCGGDLGRHNEINIEGDAITGQSILNSAEQRLQSGGFIRDSSRIKEIPAIKYGAVSIQQEKHYDNSSRSIYSMQCLIADGKPIPCEPITFDTLKGIVELSNEPIECDIVFSKIKGLDEVDQIIEQLSIGDRLELKSWGMSRVEYGKTLIGYTKPDIPGPMGSYAFAEIAELVPLSQKRKGSKYPSMKVRIKPVFTVEEYINKKAD